MKLSESLERSCTNVNRKKSKFMEKIRIFLQLGSCDINPRQKRKSERRKWKNVNNKENHSHEH